MPSPHHSLLILYTAILLLALNGLFSKLIPLDAVSVTQLRSVVAAVALIVLLRIQKQPLKLRNRFQLLGVYGLGIIMGLHWVTFFHAMQISTVAVGMLSLFSYPVITVILEPFYKGQSPKIKDLIAGAVVFAGVLVMVSEDLQRSKFSLESSHLVNGAVWGVISALLFSLRNIWQKYRFSNVPSTSLMLHQVIAIALMLLIFVDVKAVSEFSIKSWVLLVLLGVFTTAGAHTLLIFSLKHIPAKSVAMISCLQPLIGAVLAWWILEEMISHYVLIGGAIIISVALYETIKQRNKLPIP